MAPESKNSGKAARRKKTAHADTNLRSWIDCLRADAPPDTVRNRVLASLCELSGASAAFLILFHDAEHETFSLGDLDPDRYKTAIQKLAARPDLAFRSRNLSMAKLQFANSLLGMIGLVNSGLSETELCEISTVLSLYEHHRKLQQLLEVNEKSLKNLAGQSALIVRNNTRLFEQLNSNITRLQTMSKGVLRMQEEERSKISRELHDGIGQELTALKMNLDLVFADLRKEISTESRRQLEEARKTAEQSLSDVRELSRLLRPRMLDDLGLLPTLRWFARTFSKRTGVRVVLKTNGVDSKFDREIETIVFRITQEALNNIAKHSGSNLATVKLTCLSRSIRLRIEDKGAGFDISKLDRANTDEFGSGLSGIRDRVTLWGGNFSIQSEPGRGTRLQIEIPGELEKVGRG